MTNEQKAKEISDRYYMPDTGFNREDMYYSAMEMAEWKDKCLQTVIDRIKESYQLDRSAILICDLIELRYKDKFK